MKNGERLPLNLADVLFSACLFIFHLLFSACASFTAAVCFVSVKATRLCYFRLHSILRHLEL